MTWVLEKQMWTAGLNIWWNCLQTFSPQKHSRGEHCRQWRTEGGLFGILSSHGFWAGEFWFENSAGAQVGFSEIQNVELSKYQSSIIHCCLQKESVEAQGRRKTRPHRGAAFFCRLRAGWSNLSKYKMMIFFVCDCGACFSLFFNKTRFEYEVRIYCHADSMAALKTQNCGRVFFCDASYFCWRSQNFKAIWLWPAITPVQNLIRSISPTFSESSGR